MGIDQTWDNGVPAQIDHWIIAGSGGRGGHGGDSLARDSNIGIGTDLPGAYIDQLARVDDLRFLTMLRMQGGTDCKQGEEKIAALLGVEDQAGVLGIPPGSSRVVVDHAIDSMTASSLSFS